MQRNSNVFNFFTLVDREFMQSYTDDSVHDSINLTDEQAIAEMGKDCHFLFFTLGEAEFIALHREESLKRMRVESLQQQVEAKPEEDQVKPNGKKKKRKGSRLQLHRAGRGVPAVEMIPEVAAEQQPVVMYARFLELNQTTIDRRSPLHSRSPSVDLIDSSSVSESPKGSPKLIKADSM